MTTGPSSSLGHRALPELETWVADQHLRTCSAMREAVRKGHPDDHVNGESAGASSGEEEVG